MKKTSSPFLFLLPVMLLLAPVLSFAQILDPVKWSFGQKKVKDNVYDLTFTATIEQGWHIFPQTLPADATPLPTEFRFDEVKGCKLEGKVKESGEVHMTKDFPDTTLTYKTYEKKAVFTQRVVLEEGQGIVKGSLTFMTCKEVCLPPKDEEFSFVLQGNIKSTPEGTQPGDTTGLVEPSNTDVRAAGETIDTAAVAKAEEEALLKSTAEQELIEDKQSLKDKSLWRIFLIGFGAGAFSLITPCVYSMIPLTVTFFTKQKGNRKKGICQALMYAFSIIVIFVLIGVILYMFNVSSDSVNEFASNGVFNFALFLLFMVFAVSFFGVFEITLPTSWINKSENMSDKGGLLGIFFMAFTLVLVSFSCTAPFVGSALALITQGHAAGPIVGMFAYSLAFALPFGLFAFFPNWLQSLPKSGGWLNVIKVTFAFVELALALKFLSNVDLAYHWRFLDREIFLTLWIIIFALLGLYLLGFIRFSHDTPMEHLSVPRLMFAIVSLSFALYMVPGLWGAPLKAISAFAPPQSTQDFDLSKRYDAMFTPAAPQTPRKYADILHAPHGIQSYFDYEEGMEAARKAGKPVMLDFTGHSCVNCRKMEASVWSDPEVLRRLKNDFVLISLYVDDRTELAEDERYVSKYSGKQIRTIGNKNSDIQVSKYNTNSQPYYVLLDHNENMLTPPRGYDEDKAAYIGFLEAGVKKFNETKQPQP